MRLVDPQGGLGEHLFDRVEVGAAGRTELQAGACASDRRAHCFGFVAAEVVHDEDVAAAERRNHLRFDVDSERGVNAEAEFPSSLCVLVTSQLSRRFGPPFGPSSFFRRGGGMMDAFARACSGMGSAWCLNR